MWRPAGLAFFCGTGFPAGLSFFQFRVSSSPALCLPSASKRRKCSPGAPGREPLETRAPDELSPNGATGCSQWRKPLETRSDELSPNGATPHGTRGLQRPRYCYGPDGQDESPALRSGPFTALPRRHTVWSPSTHPFQSRFSGLLPPACGRLQPTGQCRHLQVGVAGTFIPPVLRAVLREPASRALLVGRVRRRKPAEAGCEREERTRGLPSLG